MIDEQLRILQQAIETLRTRQGRHRKPIHDGRPCSCCIAVHLVLTHPDVLRVLHQSSVGNLPKRETEGGE